MKNILFTLIISLIGIKGSFSQPNTEWESTFAKSAYDRPYGITSNSMGELLLCGSTWNDSNRTYEGTIIKMDFQGNKIWQKVFGYGNTDILNSIATVPSGGYVAAGYTDSKGAGSDDFWVIKIDERGNLLWEKTYGDKFEDKAENIFVTKSGELIVSGSKMTVSSSTIEGWVLKLTADGEKIWDKQFGGHFRSRAFAAAELNDKYIIAGSMEPLNEEKYKEDKGQVIALDQNGNKVWEKIFGGAEEDWFNDVLVTKQNEIMLAGLTRSKGKGSEDFWVMKLNEKGDMIWEQTFGDVSKDVAQSIVLAEDGFVICGQTDSRETNSTDISIVKYDYSGKFLWSTAIGKEMNERPYQMLATADGGFVIASERCSHYKYDSQPVKCGMSVVKLVGTPEKSIEKYVSLKVKAWEKKGEFEKTEAFQKRVTNDNKKKIIEKHTREAVTYYAEQAIDLGKGTLSDYDADKEEYAISVKGLAPLRVRVSMEGAQALKENFPSVQFENSEYSLQSGKFELEKVMMVVGGKEYQYLSARQPAIKDGVPNVFVQTGERKSADGTVYRGSGDPLKGLNISKSKTIIGTGKYFALLIGIDNYKGQWPPLQNAVRDAQGVELMLKNKYKFDNFKALYDEQATRENIMNAMVWLVENASENDNVLIFYSGHGEFNKALNKGYWVPADAQTTSISAYISNSDLQTFLGGIKSKHTLLVSDACFSGDIFRGNTVTVKMETAEKYYTETYNLKSRQAMTSGGIEPVMDGGKDGHSIFAYYFLQALRNNEGPFVDASQIFEKLKIPVANNSDQKPNLQPVKNAGDEGGQFIFIRK